MIKKHTYLIPSDRCGVWWVSVFHLYKGSFRKTAYVGDFVKVSVKITKPNNWIKKKIKRNINKIKKRRYKKRRLIFKFQNK